MHSSWSVMDASVK